MTCAPPSACANSCSNHCSSADDCGTEDSSAMVCPPFMCACARAHPSDAGYLPPDGEQNVCQHAGQGAMESRRRPEEPARVRYDTSVLGQHNLDIHVGVI